MRNFFAHHEHPSKSFLNPLQHPRFFAFFGLLPQEVLFDQTVVAAALAAFCETAVGFELFFSLVAKEVAEVADDELFALFFVLEDDGLDMDWFGKRLLFDF